MRKLAKVVCLPTENISRLYRSKDSNFVEENSFFTTKLNMRNSDITQNYGLYGFIRTAPMDCNYILVDNVLVLQAKRSVVDGLVVERPDGTRLILSDKEEVLYASSDALLTPLNRFTDSFVDRWALEANQDHFISEIQLEFDGTSLKIRNDGTVYAHQSKLLSIREASEVLKRFQEYLKLNQIEPEDIPDWLLADLKQNDFKC